MPLVYITIITYQSAFNVSLRSVSEYCRPLLRLSLGHHRIHTQGSHVVYFDPSDQDLIKSNTTTFNITD